MKILPRALAAALLPMALAVATTSDAAPSAPAGAVGPRVAPAGRPSAVKRASKLEAKNVAAVPGETKSFEATLVGPGPLAGQRVAFRVLPKNGSSVPGGAFDAGSGVTDAQGKVAVKVVLPELAQANYTIKATFAGSDDNLATSDEANLLMVKAITSFEMSDLIWGTYKNEPGPPSGSIMVSLKRNVDGSLVKRRPAKITLTPQGQPAKTWTLAGADYHWSIPLLPSSATSWKVRVEYEGDDVYQPTSAEKTYTRP